MESKIMLIDDDMFLLKRIAAHLKSAGYLTKVYLEGDSAVREFSSWNPDLVLLDLHLPGMDGFAVCQKLRAVSDVPIIILSSDDQVADKIRVLDAGADDYVIKPPDLGELGARIRAALRRRFASPLLSDKNRIGEYVSYPDLLINLTNYAVIYEGKEISMPPKELELLYRLASSPNRVFTREQLLDYVWGYDYLGDARTVDVHIKRIRQKIKDHAAWSLTTVWGVGYKFTTSSQTF
ncbi:MAG: response regulator transcription factor [Eubacteriales bacterium]|nr:response regulator transcription factor [Eubacteriales bacterium]